MPSLPEDKLAQLEKRFDSVEAALASGPSAEEYVRLSKEYAEPEWYADLWLTIVWVVITHPPAAV